MAKYFASLIMVLAMAGQASANLEVQCELELSGEEEAIPLLFELGKAANASTVQLKFCEGPEQCEIMDLAVVQSEEVDGHRLVGFGFFMGVLQYEFPTQILWDEKVNEFEVIVRANIAGDESQSTSRCTKG